jgi:hypothetical protein
LPGRWRREGRGVTAPTQAELAYLLARRGDRVDVARVVDTDVHDAITEAAAARPLDDSAA